MHDEAEHHLVTARELKEQLSKIPDDSRLAFIADGMVFQFLGIAPDTRPGVEGVLVVCTIPLSSSKATTSVNVPPVSLPIRQPTP